MKTFKLILLLALVFLTGAVAGVVGTRIAVRHFVREAILNPDRVPNLIERGLDRQLRLDSGQRVKLRQILLDAHGQLREVRQQCRPQVIGIVSNANQQIILILTPDQQARFEEMKRKNRALFQAAQENR